MVKAEIVVAIDVGTSGTRTVAFNAKNGQILAQAYQEYRSIFPRPAWVEQNAEDWWGTASATAKATLKKLGSKISQIVAVSITNQRETIVPVDKKGQPIHNAIVWQDRRTIPQCQYIEEKMGTDIVYDETGLMIDPYFSASKILWLREAQPKIFQRTHKFLLVHDFILHRLANEFATDFSNASRTMLFAIKQMKWSDIMCDGLEIPKEKLPSAHPSGTQIGQITRISSRATGFPEGLPVVVGGGDQQCGAVGVGVVKPGRVKATIGTGTFILAFEDQPRFDPQHRILCSCHAVPGKWIVEVSIFTSGIVYRWFRDQFAQEEKVLATFLQKNAYELMNNQASRSTPGARGILLLPHFMGAGAPYWNPNARGVLVGLALGHTRADILRAIMEGTSFEVRRNLEVMKSLEIKLQELRLTGGATRSTEWNQILADISNMTVQRSQVEEATALGAAILAAVGVGIYRSPSAAAEKMVAMGEKYTPSLQHQGLYDTLYNIHSDVYTALEKAKVFSRLGTLDN